MLWALRAVFLVIGAGLLAWLASWELQRARRKDAATAGGASELASAAINAASAVTQPVLDPEDEEPGWGEGGDGPIVDWPPEDDRVIVALRLVSVGTSRFSGYAIRQALEAEGFAIGRYNIFHKGEDSGRAYLSAASLTKPGAFDLVGMDSERFGGLSLFAVLPGPKSPLDTFDDLLTTARGLNDRLQGALQDESGLPLTPLRVSNLRRGLTMEPPAA